MIIYSWMLHSNRGTFSNIQRFRPTRQLGITKNQTTVISTGRNQKSKVYGKQTIRKLDKLGKISVKKTTKGDRKSGEGLPTPKY